jgi:hypothetical protein
MAATLTQPTPHHDSERERLRLRRRRDRHARLATDRALTEVAFELRARSGKIAASIPGSATSARRTSRAGAPERARHDSNP